MNKYLFAKMYQQFPALWYIRKFPMNQSLMFGLKVGLAAGAIYYIADQGVWRNGDESIKLSGKISTNASPYTDEIKKQIPYELPSLPETDNLSYLAKHSWNKGVIATFNFLANVPTYIGDMADKGLNSLMDNTEIKNLFIQNAENVDTKKE